MSRDWVACRLRASLRSACVMRHTAKATFGVVADADTEWKEQGLCRSYGCPDLWFPEGRGSKRRKQENEAVLVCVQCPMLRRCREYALENHETFGVWAGLRESELRKLVGKAGQ